LVAACAAWRALPSALRTFKLVDNKQNSTFAKTMAFWPRGDTGAGSTRDIEAISTTTNMIYSYTGFTCGSGANTKNGTYNGVTTLAGEDATAFAPVGIWYTP
jgi:hypothetical protein